jgi:hypothetical protein
MAMRRKVRADASALYDEFWSKLDLGVGGGARQVFTLLLLAIRMLNKSNAACMNENEVVVER